jgi:hypothetical protein
VLTELDIVGADHFLYPIRGNVRERIRSR